MADWFVAFRDVHQQAREAAAGGDGGVAFAAGPRAKQKPRRRKVKVAAGEGKGGDGREQQRQEEGEAAWQREVAARFMQATSELQFVGLIRPAKRRRRGAYVQRLVHMPALGAA